MCFKNKVKKSLINLESNRYEDLIKQIENYFTRLCDINLKIIGNKINKKNNKTYYILSNFDGTYKIKVEYILTTYNEFYKIKIYLDINYLFSV